MEKEEKKLVVFPQTVEEWNALPNEVKVRLLFHDTWLGDVRRDNLWYHYTTVDALATMIVKEGIEMWATQCQFLNDRNEIQEGLKILKPMLSNILSKTDNADEKLDKIKKNRVQIEHGSFYICRCLFKLIYLPDDLLHAV